MRRNKSLLRLLFFGVCWVTTLDVSAQNVLNATFGKGITLIARDSSFLIKPSFRFQTQYSGIWDDSENWKESMMIRRSRLKFDGYAFSPKVVYKLELGLSNRDTRAGRINEAGNTASIILDAVIKWKFAPSWSLWFGQTKLPGNRERIISSQKLQFVDRSPVNSNFNLDRDIGVQLHHKSTHGSFVWTQSLAVSSGEGRDIIATNSTGGRQYTAKLEFYPFGSFHSGGAYVGSDIFREPTPKLAIAVAGDYNNNALRSRGNLGSFVTNEDNFYTPSDLYTIFVDGIFKHEGISAAFEYAYRDSHNRVTNFGYGSGVTVSAGYLFKNGFEMAGRYTSVDALSAYSSIGDLDEYMLGLSRYVVGHNLKIQSDISYNSIPDNNSFMRFRLQTEFAF